MIEFEETDYLNVLRVSACLSVIVYHVFTTMGLVFVSSLTKPEQLFCDIMACLFLWHVPSFVMISGVLILNKEKELSVSRIYKKYILRIILTLIIFGIPFAFMEIFFNAHYQFNIGQIGKSILNVFEGKLWDHMWYLYMIIGLYILLPLFKVFVNYSDKKTLKYVLIVLFIFTSVMPSFEASFPSLRIGIYIPINSVFVFYLLLGHYIHQYNIRVKNKWLCLIAGLYVLYIIVNPLKNINNESGIIGLNDNVSPFVVMITFCVFCYIRQNIASNRLIKFISPHTFSMYLIHPLFLNIIFKFIKFTPEKHPMIIVLFVATITAALSSLLFSIIARKINFMKKYIL